MEIVLTKIFKNGNLQNNFFKSFNHLNHFQKDLVYKFISDASKEKTMCGRNKGQYYEKYNIFHYHIGYKEYNNFFTLNCDHRNCQKLAENSNGLTSEGVIYYIKYNSKIYILAFGEKHSPFPTDSEFFKILKSFVNF